MKSSSQRFPVSGSHRMLRAGGCLAALWAGQAMCAEVNDDWTRNFRLGAQLLFNVKANFTLNGPISVNRQSPGPVDVAGQNHYYDDGYVLVDNTGNAGGDTSYWGYNYASQIVGDQLVMKSVRAYQASETYSDSAGVSPGLDVAYGSQIRDWGKVRIGWEAGYQFTPFTFKDPTTLDTVFLRDVQAFNLGGIAVPPAPYSGGPSGIGPSIRDIAKGLPDEIVPGTITGARELDVNLHALRAGATVFWRFQPRWALSGSLGPALGLVPGSYTYNETFNFDDGTTAGESGDMSHTEVVFGGYVSAVLHYRIISSADVYLGGQFMGLTSAEFGNSQREASLDLGATFALSLGVNWPF
ncbi:MAG: hypothetical protein JNL10_18995 [Verrucomicrobiales bacterium]|nr:hypothetical protein [Verrucomicrobiales bacterium]